VSNFVASYWDFNHSNHNVAFGSASLLIIRIINLYTFFSCYAPWEIPLNSSTYQDFVLIFDIDHKFIQKQF